MTIDQIRRDYQRALITNLLTMLPTVEYFSTDDVRAATGALPTGVHPNNIGAAFRKTIPALIKDGVIEVVGTTHSVLPQGHRRRLPVYRSLISTG